MVGFSRRLGSLGMGLLGGSGWVLVKGVAARRWRWWWWEGRAKVWRREPALSLKFVRSMVGVMVLLVVEGGVEKVRESLWSSDWERVVMSM